MTRYTANLSSDGYIYNKTNGLTGGLHTYGVIKPEAKIQNLPEDKIWDAVVIGAGYTGLIAARDLVKAGKFMYVGKVSSSKVADSIQERECSC